MSKYSNEFKLEVVNYCLEEYYEFIVIAKYFIVINVKFIISFKH